jgi:hypothetical protein
MLSKLLGNKEKVGRNGYACYPKSASEKYRIFLHKKGYAVFFWG